jgi:hypothetical protein
MATIEQLQRMIDESKTIGKHLLLEVSPGIWIAADEFRETKDGIRLIRNGSTSGYIGKYVFADIPWKVTRKKNTPCKEKKK